jgi:hypothetical protein
VDPTVRAASQSHPLPLLEPTPTPDYVAALGARRSAPCRSLPPPSFALGRSTAEIATRCARPPLPRARPTAPLPVPASRRAGGAPPCPCLASGRQRPSQPLPRDGPVAGGRHIRPCHAPGRRRPPCTCLRSVGGASPHPRLASTGSAPPRPCLVSIQSAAGGRQEAGSSTRTMCQASGAPSHACL